MGETELRDLLGVAFAAESTALLISLREHTAHLGDGTREREAVVRVVLRDLHTLKGAASAIGLENVTIICHALEDLVAQLHADLALLDDGMLERIRRGLGFIERVCHGGQDNDMVAVLSGLRVGMDPVITDTDGDSHPLARTSEIEARLDALHGAWYGLRSEAQAYMRGHHTPDPEVIEQLDVLAGQLHALRSRIAGPSEPPEQLSGNGPSEPPEQLSGNERTANPSSEQQAAESGRAVEAGACVLKPEFPQNRFLQPVDGLLH